MNFITNLPKKTKVILGIIIGVIVLWAIYHFVFAKPAAEKKAADDAAAIASAAAAETAAAAIKAQADATNGSPAN